MLLLCARLCELQINPWSGVQCSKQEKHWKTGTRKAPDHQNLFPAGACSGSVDRVHRDHAGECVCVYKYTVLVHVSGQSGGPRLANPNNTKGSIFVSFHRSTRTEMEPFQDYLRSVPCFGWVPSAAFGVKSSPSLLCGFSSTIRASSAPMSRGDIFPAEGGKQAAAASGRALLCWNPFYCSSTVSRDRINSSV